MVEMTIKNQFTEIFDNARGLRDYFREVIL